MTYVAWGGDSSTWPVRLFEAGLLVFVCVMAWRLFASAVVVLTCTGGLATYVFRNQGRFAVDGGEGVHVRWRPRDQAKDGEVLPRVVPRGGVEVWNWA